MDKISTMLWFDTQAEEAANFYVSLFANSRITHVTRYGDGGPGPKGAVMVIGFELDGRPFSGLNGGPLFKFTEAVSMVVHCDDQAEIDRLWDALITDGGVPSMCGWLKDRWGLSWQIVPRKLDEWAKGPPERMGRMMAAVMQMRKLDMAAMQAAYDG